MAFTMATKTTKSNNLSVYFFIGVIQILAFLANPSGGSTLKCPLPYKLVGSQCLFFSQPYPPWGISENWTEAYLNYYDAVAMCRVMGGGDLAESVKSFPAAEKYCKRARGGCAPSLISRNGICFQWSPLDGSELAINCRRWEVQTRYICEWKPAQDRWSLPSEEDLDSTSVANDIKSVQF